MQGITVTGIIPTYIRADSQHRAKNSPHNVAARCHQRVLFRAVPVCFAKLPFYSRALVADSTRGAIAKPQDGSPSLLPRIPIHYLHGVSQQAAYLSGEADGSDSAIEGDFRTHEVGPCRLCAQQGACHGITCICGRHSMAHGSIGGAMRRHAAANGTGPHGHPGLASLTLAVE